MAKTIRTGSFSFGVFFEAMPTTIFLSLFALMHVMGGVRLFLDMRRDSPNTEYRCQSISLRSRPPSTRTMI